MKKRHVFDTKGIYKFDPLKGTHRLLIVDDGKAQVRRDGVALHGIVKVRKGESFDVIVPEGGQVEITEYVWPLSVNEWTTAGSYTWKVPRGA